MADLAEVQHRCLATPSRAGFARTGSASILEEMAQELSRFRRLARPAPCSGKVRHCHGDLHLRNICLLDGKPTLFDCLEFSEALASIDVLYDLAFLVMDLEHRGLGAFRQSRVQPLPRPQRGG